jgi:hypothetical protein
MLNLAENPEYQDEIESLIALMGDWRREIGDSDSLRASHPESKAVDYSQFNRVLDQWQSQWIIDKYFSGLQ